MKLKLARGVDKGKKGLSCVDGFCAEISKSRAGHSVDQTESPPRSTELRILRRYFLTFACISSIMAEAKRFPISNRPSVLKCTLSPPRGTSSQLKIRKFGSLTESWALRTMSR